VSLNQIVDQCYRMLKYYSESFLVCFPILKKNMVGLWDHVAVRVCVCVCVFPLSLLGNCSVKVPVSLLSNGCVFYAGHVVSKESRRLFFPRTSCYNVYRWFELACVICNQPIAGWETKARTQRSGVIVVTTHSTVYRPTNEIRYGYVGLVALTEDSATGKKIEVA
jgi:hypothetical protein